MQKSCPGFSFTPCYWGDDHLGSVRLVMDKNHQVLARHDYLPFGEEIQAGPADRPAYWETSSGAHKEWRTPDAPQRWKRRWWGQGVVRRSPPKNK